MIKPLLITVFSVSIAVNALAFDQARFDRDTQSFNNHKDDAKAIVTLLSIFNTDSGIRGVFEQQANGNPAKWQETLNKMNKAGNYAEKMGEFNYFFSCINAVNYAKLMWLSAPKGLKITAWQDKNSSDLKQFQAVKVQFQNEYLDCKNALKNPPNKKDYANDLLIIE